jgi:hypothetical protein
MTALAEDKIAASAGQDSSGSFSLKMIIGLLAVGVLSFAAFIVLSAFADDLRKPEDGGPHAESKSAVGYEALVDLLQGEGMRVRVSRGALRELKGYNQLTVLTPRNGEEFESAALYSMTGDVLIVLSKWDAWPDWDHPGWVMSDGLADPVHSEKLLKAYRINMSIGQSPGALDRVLRREGGVNADLPAGKIERLQTVSSGDIQPILTDGGGHTVLGRLLGPFRYGFYAPPPVPATPDAEQLPSDDQFDDDAADPPGPPAPFTPGGDQGRSIFILSEPDLLNTKGLHSLETAKAAVDLFRTIGADNKEVVFDMSLHGFERSRNFMKLLLEPPFLPAMLCLAFAGALMAFNSVAGRLRMRSGREIALGKETLVENSALLVSLAGRDTHMGKRYAAMTRMLAAVAAGVPARAPETQQASLLDAVSRAGEDKTKYSQLADEVSNAGTTSNMLKAANRLFRWRQEIGRERRGR